MGGAGGRWQERRQTRTCDNKDILQTGYLDPQWNSSQCAKGLESQDINALKFTFVLSLGTRTCSPSAREIPLTDVVINVAVLVILYNLRPFNQKKKKTFPSILPEHNSRTFVTFSKAISFLSWLRPLTPLLCLLKWQSVVSLKWLLTLARVAALWQVFIALLTTSSPWEPTRHPGRSVAKLRILIVTILVAMLKSVWTSLEV